MKGSAKEGKAMMRGGARSAWPCKVTSASRTLSHSAPHLPCRFLIDMPLESRRLFLSSGAQAVERIPVGICRVHVITFTTPRCPSLFPLTVLSAAMPVTWQCLPSTGIHGSIVLSTYVGRVPICIRRNVFRRLIASMLSIVVPFCCAYFDLRCSDYWACRPCACSLPRCF